jgi:hypothetical protein
MQISVHLSEIINHYVDTERFESIQRYGSLVAGPGGAPGLEDYEPSVLLYTTPRYVKEHRIIL